MEKVISKCYKHKVYEADFHIMCYYVSSGLMVSVKISTKDL